MSSFRRETDTDMRRLSSSDNAEHQTQSSYPNRNTYLTVFHLFISIKNAIKIHLQLCSFCFSIV